MPLYLCKKFFDHTPEPLPSIVQEAFVVFASPRYEKTAETEFKFPSSVLRRKRSLAIISQNPDMTSIQALRHYADVLLAEYGIEYSGRLNQFKFQYDNQRVNRILGYLEVASQVFIERRVEMDLILKNHNKKEIKSAHAIRDCGTFSPTDYEYARSQALRAILEGIPKPREFNLLAGAEELVRERE